MRFFVRTVVVALLCGTAAAESDGLAVELNKLESGDNACRAYLVLDNRTGIDFSTLKLDLVMFDPDGIVADRLAVETAPLPARKTMLRVFDIDDLPCGQLSRLLLNDVVSCHDSAGALDDCLAMISVDARPGLSFFK